MTRPRTTLRLWLSASVLLLSPLAGPVLALHETIDLGITDQSLPSPTGWTAAAYTNDRFYVFGGERNGIAGTDAIVSYDPTMGTTKILPARLPHALRATSAVVDPETGDVYLFGGKFSGSPWWSDQILRFDPKRQTTEVLDTRLPNPMAWSAAVWHDDAAYIIGGTGGEDPNDAILRFDPASQTVRDTGAKLPFPRMAASAVSTGTQIWIFGGEDTRVGMTGQVVRFVPETNKVTTNWEAALPSPRAYTSAVWDGTTAWVLGGGTSDGATDEVVSFTRNPANEAFIGIHLHEPLPEPRFGASAAAGHKMLPPPGAVEARVTDVPADVGIPHTYVFGGIKPHGPSSERYLDEIVDYRPLGTSIVQR